MDQEHTSQRRVWPLIIMILVVVVVILLLLTRCSGCTDQSLEDHEEAVDGTAAAAAVPEQDYSGELRIISTDGLYIHPVVVEDAEGVVVARGDTGNPFAVPEGSFTVRVQGQRFPVTVQRDQKMVVSVQEAVGLGRLSMPAPSGHPYPNIVPITVTDLDGNEVATGRSGAPIDLLPGRYRVTQEERSLEVEITAGETTRIDPE